MAPTSRFLSQRKETTDELVQKASDYLKKIGVCLATNLQDLPAEIRRDRHCFHNDGLLFSLLDLHLRYSTLDAFLRKHPPCMQMVAFVFGGRHPRLIQDADVLRALAAADGTCSSDAPKMLLTKNKKRRAGSQQMPAADFRWVPKRARGEDGTWVAVPLGERERLVLDAFDGFRPVGDDPRIPPSARGKFLAPSQFEALRGKMRGGSTYLAFTLPPRSVSPGPEPASTQHEASTAQASHMPAIVESTPASAAAPVSATAEDARFMEYKGCLIEPPASVLNKLKTYLCNPDLDQQLDWGNIRVEIQEYLAHLLRNRAESWASLLDELVGMFRAHSIYDGFHSDHKGLDHSLWADIMEPKYALQRPPPPAVSQSTQQPAAPKGEKSKADAMPPPPPPSPLEDGDGKDLIAFSGMMLAETPPGKEGARDPYAYTRWHNRLRENLARARDDARDETAAQMRERERERQETTHEEGCVVMDMPQNGSGPVVVAGYPPLMDAEMRKTAGDRARLLLLCQALRRAARRSPRPLMDGVLEHLDLGIKASEAAPNCRGGNASPLQASDDGGGGGVFARLQREEINWLGFLCQPSLNASRTTDHRQDPPLSGDVGGEEEEEEDWKMAVLCRRVGKMPCSSLARGSFGDGLRVTVRGFLDLVNQDCDGPVKGHRFTMEELESRMPELEGRKMVQISHDQGVQHVRCFPGDVHPEEAIRWPEERTLSKEEEEEEEDQGPAADAATHLDAPPSTIPSMDHLRTVEECLLDNNQQERFKRDDDGDDAERTAAFFRRLAYRLGRTLRDVEAQSEHDMRLLAPARQRANAISLDALLRRWSANAAGAVAPPCRDGRRIATYRDVVLAADPEALPGGGGGGQEVEAELEERRCKELVRRNILCEASEDKTMLWPVAVPRDSSVVVGDAADGRTALRREAVWSFAKRDAAAAAAAPAPKYFDVNNWPLELQTKERQAEIRGSAS